jgi:hypothetical protein
LTDERVRIFTDGKHLGLAARLNTIVRLARGKYVARMDADDLMHPKRLQAQVGLLIRHPELDGTGCGLVILDRKGHPDGVLLHPSEHESICADVLAGVKIAHATLVGRVQWFRGHPYNETNRGCEDLELWLSTFHNSRLANLSEPLYFYREFNTFRLAKYIRRKKDTIRTLWRHRRNMGLTRTALCCLGHCLRVPTYVSCSAIGVQDLLIRARSSRITSEQRLLFLEVLAEVRSASLPRSEVHFRSLSCQCAVNTAKERQENLGASTIRVK